MVLGLRDFLYFIKLHYCNKGKGSEMDDSSSVADSRSSLLALSLIIVPRLVLDVYS